MTTMEVNENGDSRDGKHFLVQLTKNQNFQAWISCMKKIRVMRTKRLLQLATFESISHSKSSRWLARTKLIWMDSQQSMVP